MDEIRAGLVAGGYRDARATAELDPLDGGRADLSVKIERGRLWRVASIEWQAPEGSPTESWERELVSLRRRTFFPGLPPLWDGWRSKAVYREESLRAYLARLESRLLAEGRLDVRVAASSSFSEDGRSEVTVAVRPGPKYRFSRIEAPSGLELEPLRQADWRERLCACALAAQRQADQDGRLDFAARLEFQRTDGDLARGRLSFEPGPSYEVGRIEFEGLRDIEEGGLRRALLLDEAETLDVVRLRRSLARLSRHPALEPVTPADVRIERRGDQPVADVIFHLQERPRGRWSLSGPLGPMSWFGGLSFSVESRLPGWGQGLWRLSTFAVSASVFSWEQPLLTTLGWDWKTAWTPLLTLRRPLTPGRFWTSGWIYAPQLGWKGSLALAGMERARSLGAPLLAPGSASEEIAIPVFIAVDGDQQRRGSLYCRHRRGSWERSRSALNRVLAMAGLSSD